ncbi:MAG: HPr family phosphocarrier protein [Clostridiaceae bacterium]
MVEKSVEITNKTGLHARPASEFAKAAGKFKSKVFAELDGRKCNAKSIIGIISLGASQGKVVTVSAEGEDEKEAVEALSSLLASFTD